MEELAVVVEEISSKEMACLAGSGPATIVEEEDDRSRLEGAG